MHPQAVLEVLHDNSCILEALLRECCGVVGVFLHDLLEHTLELVEFVSEVEETVEIEKSLVNMVSI